MTGPGKAENTAQPSAESLNGFDGMNLLLANVQDRVGSYPSVFLKCGEHWNSSATSTGRFNLAPGVTALAVGTGAGLNELVADHSVQRFGYPAGVLGLAATAICALTVCALTVCALAFFALLKPETWSVHEPAGAHA